MEQREEIVATSTEASKSNLVSSEYIEQTVREYFSDIPVMAQVAWCESRFVHIDQQTGTVKRGHLNGQDLGVMQINEHYHRETAEKMGLVIEKFEDNLAYARYLYEEKGTQPWSASKACWGEHEQHLAMK